ncbi:MAG: hypothetical protein ACE15D_06125 [Candidatus Eisenbacteria bacterium]
MTEGRARPLPGGFAGYYFDAIGLDGRHVLVACWYSGFLFSPRYYDEVLELRDRKGVQPEEGIVLADPSNHGAFSLALYDQGRTVAYLVAEEPLARGESDPWFPALHAGEPGLSGAMPPPGAKMGIGDNRVTRTADGAYELEFADRSKWFRASFEGKVRFRPLGGASAVVPLAPSGGPPSEAEQHWQILCSRAEVTGKIRWNDPISRKQNSLDLQALGYVDRNAGRLPISPRVGRWLWGRFQGSGKMLAYYRLDPAEPEPADAKSGPRPGPLSFLYTSDREREGLMPGAQIVPHRVHRNRWGMPHPLEIEGTGGDLAFRAHTVRIVDRGPFYVRTLSRLSCADPSLDGLLGITECFLPSRWDVPLYRLMARGRIRRGP